LRLHSKRQSSGVGPNSISYSDTKAFFELMQYHPATWEIEILELFDSAYMSFVSEKMEKQSKQQKTKKN
jgi:hypothetical protein